MQIKVHMDIISFPQQDQQEERIRQIITILQYKELLILELLVQNMH